LPHLATAQSQVQGLRPNLFFPTAASQLGIMFGIFLPGVLLTLRAAKTSPDRPRVRPGALALVLLTAAIAVLALGYFWSTQSAGGRAWLGALGGPADPLALVLERWQTGGAGAIVVLALLAWTLAHLAGTWAPGAPASPASRRGRRAPGTLLLLAVGLGLLAGAEVLYVQDLFGTRMNTVFKFWYQAWLFLGVVSAVGLASAGPTRRRDRLLRGGGVALLALGLLYPLFALATKTAHPRWRLDGLAALADRSPDLYAAALWLRRETPWDARLLEAPGESYHPDDNLLSAATGRATLLGWQGHEEQWRGSEFTRLAAGRREAAAAIYGATDGATLAALLERWQIDYVVFGPREHEAYGTRDPGVRRRLETLMVAVFDSDSVTILRRR
jgi:uncharacterized membrane protein